MSDDDHPPKDHGAKQLSEAMKKAGLLNPVIRGDVFGGATNALKEHSERWARIMEPLKLKPPIVPDLSAWTRVQSELGSVLSGFVKQMEAFNFKRVSTLHCKTSTLQSSVCNSSPRRVGRSRRGAKGYVRHRRLCLLVYDRRRKANSRAAELRPVDA